MILSKAIHDVLEERKRQIKKEGYTLESDDAGTRGRLAAASSCYSIHAGYFLHPDAKAGDLVSLPSFWPFSEELWKPRGPRENLVRAAALAIAELELIDRDSAKLAREADRILPEILTQDDSKLEEKIEEETMDTTEVSS